MTPPKIPMVGRTFGLLTVLEQAEPLGPGISGGLVPVRLHLRQGDHHPGQQPAAGDHPELRLLAPRGDPAAQPEEGGQGL